MKMLPLFFALIILLNACKSQQPGTHNLGFEQTVKDSAIGWRGVSRNDSSIYKTSLDQKVVRDGRYSASISFEGGKPDYTAWSYALNHKYRGDSITVSAFLKTENVTDGFAGLYMRIDPLVAFENMQNKKISGTNDWTEYTITLPLKTEKAERIVFGAILAGKGKIWVDDFKVSIDGKDINTIKPVINAPADNDREFDRGSKITIGPLTDEKTKNLYDLGLIWGFLKYYHPTVIKGARQWDYELFRVLPRILQSSGKERDAILCRWIEGLGAFEMEPHKVLPDSIVIKPDLEWITNSGFSPKLQSLLTDVKNARRTNDFQQYYVNGTPARNVAFKNERSYYGLPTLDKGFQLLALYRYWNMVQYFFPYKDIIGEDWKHILKSFIPKILHADNALDYRLRIFELAAQIHDTHAYINEDHLVGSHLGRRYLPFSLVFIDNKPVVAESYNFDAESFNNLQPGDVITNINGEPVTSRIKELSALVPASSRSTQLRDIAGYLRRTNDATKTITFIRNGKKGTIEVKTFKESSPAKKFSIFEAPPYKWIRPDIGYVDNGRLKRTDPPALFEKFKSAKGLIIDIRNYPSDFLVYDLPDFWLNGPAPFAMTSVPNSAMPGLFSFKQALKTGEKHKGLYKGKMILLVNETSQSSAEFHAMAYQTYPGCITIGSHTAGADGNVSEIVLPGYIKTQFSGIGIYYPDGKPTQRIGIVPDIIVRPTISGIINKRDEVLEKAIELISE